MDHVSSWDFTMANYDAVWAFLVQLGLLLMFLMLGNILRRTIPLFRKCLIPSALLGGGLLLIVNIICKQFGFMLVDNRLMQVITYHCLAIGFAAMSLKTEFKNVTTVFIKRDKRPLMANILAKNSSIEDKVNRLMALEYVDKNAALCDYVISFETYDQALTQLRDIFKKDK